MGKTRPNCRRVCRNSWRILWLRRRCRPSRNRLTSNSSLPRSSSKSCTTTESRNRQRSTRIFRSSFASTRSTAVPWCIRSCKDASTMSASRHFCMSSTPKRRCYELDNPSRWGTLAFLNTKSKSRTRKLCKQSRAQPNSMNSKLLNSMKGLPRPTTWRIQVLITRRLRFQKNHQTKSGPRKAPSRNHPLAWMMQASRIPRSLEQPERTRHASIENDGKASRTNIFES